MRLHRREKPQNPLLFKFFESVKKPELMRMVLRLLVESGQSTKEPEALVKALEDLRFRACTSGKGSPDHRAELQAYKTLQEVL